MKATSVVPSAAKATSSEHPFAGLSAFANREALKALGTDLKARKISQQEYSTRVELLA